MKHLTLLLFLSQLSFAQQESEAKDNQIYNSVDLQVLPEFPGGMKALYSFIYDNFRKPEVDRDISICIYIEYVIEKDGAITNIKAIKNPGYGLDKEAERVLKRLKVNWIPGIKNDKPVRARMITPITFNLKS
jgi:protein TonB